MGLPATVLNFVARNRFSLPVACGAAAAFIFVYQAELDPPPPESVDLVEVEASSIGVLQINVMGRRDNVAVAQREAGYAIEYTPRSSFTGSTLPLPTRRLFASELELTDPEVKWIRGHGPSYRISIVRDRVVSIGSMAQPLIKYERYARSAKVKRNLWRFYGVVVLALGVGAFVLGSHRHASADA